MFFKPEELILLLVCVAAGLLGMAANLLGGKNEFKNGGFFFRKILLSVFLVVTIFLCADSLVSLFGVTSEKLAWFKAIASLLGGGYFHEMTLERLENIYVNFVISRLPQPTKEEEKK